MISRERKNDNRLLQSMEFMVTFSIIGWIREEKVNFLVLVFPIEIFRCSSEVFYANVEAVEVVSYFLFQNVHGIISCMSERCLFLFNCDFMDILSLGQYNHIVVFVICNASISRLCTKILCGIGSDPVFFFNFNFNSIPIFA